MTMGEMEIVQSMGFSMPMFAAFVCCILLLMFSRSTGLIQRQLTTLMIATYLTASLCWLGVILYIVSYEGFIWFNTLFFLCLMLDQVLLYHFMFIITGTGSRCRFNPLHYTIPVALALVMGVWSLLTPYEVQYYIVESRGENAEGYLWYSRFFSATIPVFIIYNIFYPLGTLYRIRIYRREVVNYSADEYRASARWLYILVALIWFTLPIALGTLFVHKSRFFNSLLTLTGAFLPIFQYLVICNKLIAGSYVIIQFPTREEEEQDNKGKKIQPLDRIRLERFIKEEKPYINPKLKITDLSSALGTNRTYLSTFINREYGMNFSRYINRCRLKEVDRLRTSSHTSTETGTELVMRAGFSNFRGYLRVKSDEDKMDILKMFD